MLLSLGCSKTDQGMKTPEIHEYLVMPGKKIIQINDTVVNGYVNTRYEVVPGNKLVFKAMYIAEQYENILDDEHAETFWFEVDSSMTDFWYQNDSLSVTNAYFIMVGAWVPNTPFTFESGYISGRKISDEYWEIWINVETQAGNNQKIEIELNEFFQITE